LLQRKNAGDIIKKQIVELETKNAELERFTYTVSHDLKSPLITIKGFLGHIISDVRKGNFDRMESDIKRISNAVDKMEYLLKDLLELSRIGRIINPSSKFSMSSSVKEVAELVNGFLEEKHVKFSYDENMPFVYADRIRIREVWQNLIENAVKYTGNQDKPEINIGYKNTDRGDVFYIKDNGTGIEEKYYKKIFGLFEKLEQKSEGTGIGLAIVKRIIELHGGHIWVESEGKDKGSTFYFNIPLKEGKK
ncbi:MAG: ATP-binding protein, partial [Candidatus Eremiobacterota bacterium]